MTETDFYNWLSGYLELSKAETIDAAQLLIIKDHIALVKSEKKQPTYYPPTPLITHPLDVGNPFPTAPAPGPCGWEVTCGDKTQEYKEFDGRPIFTLSNGRKLCGFRSYDESDQIKMFSQTC